MRPRHFAAGKGKQPGIRLLSKYLKSHAGNREGDMFFSKNEPPQENLRGNFASGDIQLCGVVFSSVTQIYPE